MSPDGSPTRPRFSSVKVVESDDSLVLRWQTISPAGVFLAFFFVGNAIGAWLYVINNCEQTATKGGTPPEGFGYGESDESAITVRGLVTAHGNSLEALQLADGLLDSATRLVEQSWKELRLVLGILAMRNDWREHRFPSCWSVA